MSRSDSKRQERQLRQRRKQIRNWSIAGAAGLIVIAVMVLAVRDLTRPISGEAMPIEGADHVEDGALPEQVSVDPPTSGAHYEESTEAGFYEEPVADGYLIHSLEHGYVIISYNCDGLSDSECGDLKTGVSDIVDSFDTYKVIGVPRPGMDVPVVLTSWGRIDRLEQFDEESVREFVRNNRGNAPEPDAS